MSKRVFWDQMKVISADAADRFLAWAGHASSESPSSTGTASPGKAVGGQSSPKPTSPRRHQSHSHMAAAVTNPFKRIHVLLTDLAKAVVSSNYSDAALTATASGTSKLSPVAGAAGYDDADEPFPDELAAESSLFGTLSDDTVFFRDGLCTSPLLQYALWPPTSWNGTNV